MAGLRRPNAEASEDDSMPFTNSSAETTASSAASGTSAADHSSHGVLGKEGQVEGWDFDAVGRWLAGHSFGDLSEVFRSNEIDGSLLLELDHETLKSMGIAIAGKRVRILKAIATLAAANDLVRSARGASGDASEMKTPGRTACVPTPL